MDAACDSPYCNSTNVTHDSENSNVTYLEISLGFLIIGIIGIFSNLFATLILSSSPKIRRKLVNTLIIHQSFVDLLASIALVGMAHLDGGDPHGLHGVHADIYCFFISGKWPLRVMMDVSSFGLMFLNVERYISIVFPIYHHTKVTRKKVVMLLPILWLLGILEQCLVSMSFKPQNGACGFASPGMFEFTVMTFLILHFFLPVTLVLFLYGHMFIRLRRNVKSGNGSTSSNRSDVMEKARNNVFKTMLLITICYAVCYVFNSVYVLLVTRGILNTFTGQFYSFTVYMVCVNSIINPFVYAIQYQEFQNRMREMFCQKTVPPEGSTSSVSVTIESSIK